MNRRTSRADFRNELTTEEIAELLQELCIKRRLLCDMQRRLYPLSEEAVHIEKLKRAIDDCQARWTGNPGHFHAGHTVMRVEPAND